MPVCDDCTMDPCECVKYGPGETPPHQQPQCEVCGERPGNINSRFILDDDDDTGVWICIPCEEQAESCNLYPLTPDPDDDPALIDPYYELDGEYEMDVSDDANYFGGYVSPFIDEEREEGR